MILPLTPKPFPADPKTISIFSETIPCGSKVAKTEEDTHRRYKRSCHLLALDLLPVQALKEWVWYQLCNCLQPFSLIGVEQLREGRDTRVMHYSGWSN